MPIGVSLPCLPSTLDAYTKCDEVRSTTNAFDVTDPVSHCLRRGFLRVHRPPSIRKMCDGRMQARFHRSQRNIQDFTDLFIRELVEVGKKKISRKCSGMEVTVSCTSFCNSRFSMGSLGSSAVLCMRSMNSPLSSSPGLIEAWSGLVGLRAWERIRSRPYWRRW